MLSLKAVVIVLLLSLASNGAGSCEAKKSGGNQNSNQSASQSVNVNRPEQSGEGAVSDELKTLSEGQQSAVSHAFVAVVRDAEAYAALGKMVSKLPDVDEDFFQSNAVVAAFLGERRTGGYSVRFNYNRDGRLRVEEKSPAKDAMTTQAITTPFSVIAVPLGSQQSLALDMGNAWSASVRHYRVTSGEFTMSGGIAGRSEQFGINGDIGVMREGNLATFIFNLQGKDVTKPRAWIDAASGLVKSDMSLRIEHLGVGSFVDRPADVLRATGLFTAKENRLSLTFDSIPGRIADGYNGGGNLQAEATAPAPKRNKSSASVQK